MIVTISALMYTYIWNSIVILKWIVGVVAVVGALRFLMKKNKTSPAPPTRLLKVKEKVEGITKLAMLSEDGEKIKEWYIHGETSLLIGKSAVDNEVEVDLADAEYASLISKQHAVLNFASNNWYLEDLDSRNGVGIKRKGAGTKQVLENETPHRIEAGDMIYIANTRLLVQ
ncbi:FHA domain-containing protein [Paenibacillus sp. SYP-B3998]|uniref:FHA domain-containing protein n=1 Tax=Paenibacillus sp. SYP-B3998 TaxID=2678564 RepID=UPI0031F881BA